MFTTIFMIPIGWMINHFDFLNQPILLIILTTLLIIIFTFLIIIHLPRMNCRALGIKIEGEIAITGRRLLIQLESGKSLVNSIIDVAKHKKESSKALERVAYELYMGKPLEQAIKEAIENSPSKTFKKIFIQIKNSLKTGSDLKHTLKAALEDITREKIIEFESFGKKLNPLGLFYMIFGTIGPSLGIVMFVIFLTIIGMPIKGAVLAMFIFAIFMIQLFFILIFSSMRPELQI
jgi:pilus assembly protein TadC